MSRALTLLSALLGAWLAGAVALAATFELVPNIADVPGPGKASPGEGEELHYFKFGDLYGYVSPEGRMAIPPVFSAAANFAANGLAPAAENGLWGLIDARGAFAILPAFKELRTLSSTGEPAVWARHYDWWGKVALDGSWLIKPRFHGFKDLGEGYCAVFYQGKAGLINAKGDFLSPPVYDDLLNLGPGPQGGFLLTFRLNNKEGLLNEKGEIVIQPRFDSISPNFDENGKFIMVLGGKYGVFDISDRWIIEPKFYNIAFHPEDGMFWVRDGIYVDNYFYYDLDGENKGPIPPEKVWADVAAKPFGLVGCFPRSNPKIWGYCDAKGEIKIPQEYDEVFLFSPAGLGRARKGGKYGFLDPSGAITIPMIYEEAGDFWEAGLAPAKDKGLWGLLSLKGEFVVQPTWEEAPEPLDGNSFWAKEKGLARLYDMEGRALSADSFAATRPFGENGLAWAQKGKLWGLIDRQGQWALSPVYDEVGEPSPNGMIPALYQGEFALLDARGALVAYVATREGGARVALNGRGEVIWPPAPEAGI
ncbi:MAG: WG repeat-containing protein [Deltaproteobacteria bacterium]|jgi:hypothetical protein|nr:WG repeat-containing protein [Deltaproteobacteria bacterium]